MSEPNQTGKKLEALSQKDQATEMAAIEAETHATGNGQFVVDSDAFRRMFQDHGAIMYIVDLATFAIIDANKAALDFYGYNLEAMLTKRVPDLNILPEAKIRAEIQRAVSEGRSYYVFKHQLADGEIRDVEVYANPILIEGKQYSFSVVHDISARRIAEESLKESERRLRESQRIAKVGSYTYHIAEDRWSSSEVLDEIFGVDNQYEKTAAGWTALVHPDDREDATVSLRRLVDEGVPFDREYRIVRISDGSVRWLHGRGELIRDAAGQPMLLLGTNQDITARRHTELHYRLLLEAIPDAVIVYDPQRQITYINDAFERIYGWTKNELIGGIIDFVPPEEVGNTREAWRRTLDGENVPFETKRFTKDGQLLDIQLRTAILKDQHGQHSASIVIHRDITSAKQAERERERLIDELQRALAEVKTLSGFLPICSSCKKIRDDKGYWNQIEAYIRDHSDAQFSHSVCPECAKQLYPEISLDKD